MTNCQQKSVHDMTVREIVELYMSNVDLDIEDDIFIQEFFWSYISNARSITDGTERDEYLKTLEFKPVLSVVYSQFQFD